MFFEILMHYELNAKINHVDHISNTAIDNENIIENTSKLQCSCY